MFEITAETESGLQKINATHDQVCEEKKQVETDLGKVWQVFYDVCAKKCNLGPWPDRLHNEHYHIIDYGTCKKCADGTETDQDVAGYSTFETEKYVTVFDLGDLRIFRRVKTKKRFKWITEYELCITMRVNHSTEHVSVFGEKLCRTISKVNVYYDNNTEWEELFQCLLEEYKKETEQTISEIDRNNELTKMQGTLVFKV
jgi:hypothetical protein